MVVGRQLVGSELVSFQSLLEIGIVSEKLGGRVGREDESMTWLTGEIGTNRKRGGGRGKTPVKAKGENAQKGGRNALL